MGMHGSRWVVAVGMALGCVAPGDEAVGATGDLTAPSCRSGDTATGPAGTGACTLVGSDPSAGGAGSGINDVGGVVASPDGNSVYVTGASDDAILHFERIAATGDLAFQECITFQTATGPIGSGACAAGPVTTPAGTNSGMDTPEDIAISGNGEDVYVVSAQDASLTHFDRNTTTGALTFAECVTGETGSSTGSGGACVATPTATPGGTLSGLHQLTGVAVMGADVYVTGAGDDSIAELNRTIANGTLSWDDCISGDSDVTACADSPVTSATGAATGLDSTFAPTVSEDGDSVYIGGSEDAAITWFNRAGGGQLSFNDCITGDTDAGPAGSVACSETVPDANAFGTGSGLLRSQSLAISADGASVYAGSQVDDTVTRFNRNTGNGDLTFASCVGGDADISACTLVPDASTTGDDSGFNQIQALAISPDGKSLYAGSFGDDAIVTFDRTLATGALSFDRCVTGETATGPAGTGACSAPAATTSGTSSGLDMLVDLELTPDGSQLLGAAQGDDSLVAALRAVAPETTLLTAPGPLTNDPTPTFTYDSDEPGSTFQCRIDAGPIGACSGAGTHTTAALTDGVHTFQVRARNDVPTPDPTPASTTFTVDTIAPETTISSGPQGLTAAAAAEFEFGAPGAASFACRIDGGGFAACTSPHTLSGIADGDHTFEVRATDLAGNVESTPASRSFEVDATAPTLTIAKGPKKTEKTKDGKKKKAKFKFTASESGVSFECSKDKGKDFKPCTSPYERKYKTGKHTFSVRPIDEAGNVGAKVVHRWKVKEKR